MTHVLEWYGERGGVLLLHGFGGSPDDVKPLGEHLAHEGFFVMAPLLHGHGGTMGELDGSGWYDWRRTADLALLDLMNRQEGRGIAVAGFSMGGLLALDLALRFPVRGAALLAPAIAIRPRGAALAGLMQRLPGMRRLALRLGFPLHAVAELVSYSRRVTGASAGATVPVLVVQGTEDERVAPDGARQLYEHLGRGPKRIHWVQGAGHGLMEGPFQGDVAQMVKTFFEQCFEGLPA